MNINQKEHRDNFLAKFNHGYDGVVRAVQLKFSPAEELGHAIVTLSVRRSGAKKNRNGWVNLRLSIDAVEEFSLRESSKESFRVLSSGLHIGSFGELLFFDFAPYSVCPAGMEDYRRSGFYVAGRSFTWREEPYSEHVAGKERKKSPHSLRKGHASTT
jgi:hypothetical protein